MVRQGIVQQFDNLVVSPDEATGVCNLCMRNLIVLDVLAVKRNAVRAEGLGILSLHCIFSKQAFGERLVFLRRLLLCQVLLDFVDVILNEWAFDNKVYAFRADLVHEQLNEEHEHSSHQKGRVLAIIAL